MAIDINKHEVDIDTLFKQNELDLCSIKNIYNKLKQLEKQINQFKYVNSSIVDKLKKQYEELEKIIIDENIQVQLNNKIDNVSEQLDTILKENFFVNVKDLGVKGGVDETELIQEIIYNATEKGQEIVFPKGEYYVDYLFLPENCTIKLEKNAKIISSKGTNHLLRNYKINDEKSLNAREYDSYSNITIYGDGIIDCKGSIFKQGAGALSFQHCKGITIRDITILDIYFVHAIELIAVKDFIVDNVKMYGYVHTDGETRFREAIQIDHALEGHGTIGLKDGTPCKDGFIQNCITDIYSERNLESYPCGCGSHFGNDSGNDKKHSNINVSNCSFKNVTYSGLSVEMWKDSNINNNYITSHQTIIDSLKASIFVERAENINIDSNVCINNANGIYCESNCNSIKIHNNSINKTSDHGIFVKQDVANIFIENNRIINSCLKNKNGESFNPITVGGNTTFYNYIYIINNIINIDNDIPLTNVIQIRGGGKNVFYNGNILNAVSTKAIDDYQTKDKIFKNKVLLSSTKSYSGNIMLNDNLSKFSMLEIQFLTPRAEIVTISTNEDYPTYRSFNLGNTIEEDYTCFMEIELQFTEKSVNILNNILVEETKSNGRIWSNATSSKGLIINKIYGIV